MPCARTHRGRDRLGADRRSVRTTGRRQPVPGHRAESSRRGGDGGGAGAGAANRRSPGTRGRFATVSPASNGARRPAVQAGTDRRGGARVRTRGRTDAERSREAPVARSRPRLRTTVNLILLDAAEVAVDGRVCLGDSRAVHLLRVVQVERGRSVRVGIIDGPVGTGRVVDVAADAVTLQCRFAELPPRPPVDLLLAVPRPKVLRRLWSQLAAMGVDRIILTNA